MLTTILAIGLIGLLTSTAVAQTAPTDTELMQARVQAAEDQLKGAVARIEYLAMLIRRQQAIDIATAKWWADYIGIKNE
jgi:hypothetical protein